MLAIYSMFTHPDNPLLESVACYDTDARVTMYECPYPDYSCSYNAQGILNCELRGSLNFTCEYENTKYYNQYNAEKCWTYEDGKCNHQTKRYFVLVLFLRLHLPLSLSLSLFTISHPNSHLLHFQTRSGEGSEQGIYEGKSHFETASYLQDYWYCEESPNGALPRVYHRFYTVSTGSSGSECSGTQASFGVDMNNDEIFVAEAAMSSAGIPLSCSTMDEVTRCSDCSLLPIKFLGIFKAKVLGAELNNLIAFFLIVLAFVIIVKELVGLIVILLVIFTEDSSVRDFNFVEVARDSIVGLVLLLAISMMDFSYLRRVFQSSGNDDNVSLKKPCPKIMSYVWMPLEYTELMVELLFSIFWIVNIYSDAFYEVPSGSEVNAILMSWTVAMFDLWMFRVPELIELIPLSWCCCRRRCSVRKNDATHKLWNILAIWIYFSLSSIGSIIYIASYYARYDTCWDMDDGITDQILEEDGWGAFCESSWSWCPYKTTKFTGWEGFWDYPY